MRRPAPENDVALVLGTAPTVGEGRWKNPFFENRMDTAAKLFRAGQSAAPVGQRRQRASGIRRANSNAERLVARGIPASAITTRLRWISDARFGRRARAVFGQTKLTIVTDDFHLPRALFLARAAGLDAVGVVSQRVPQSMVAQDAGARNRGAHRGVGRRVVAAHEAQVLRAESARSRSRAWIDQSRGCATRTVTSVLGRKLVAHADGERFERLLLQVGI
jgi:vancomycin permeability regulator SanA